MEQIQAESKPKYNKILLISIMVVLAGFAVFAYYNDSNFLNIKRLLVNSKGINANTMLSISFDPNEKNSFLTYENKVLKVTKDGITAVNANKKSEWEIKFSLKNPVAKVDGNYILVADQGGNSLYLYQGNKLLWQKALDGFINNIKLNKSGSVLVFKQKDGTNGEILGFNAKGNPILQKSYAKQGYLVNGDISEDNKRAVVLSVFTDKSKITSNVDIFDLKSTVQVNSTPVSAVYKEDALATDIRIFSNGNIVLVTDSKIVGMDGSGKDKWTKDISTTKVYRVDISSGNYVILEVNGTIKSNILENKSREVQVINGEGQQEGQGVKITSDIKNIDILDNYFIVNDSTNIYSIAKGKLIWSYPLVKDIKYAKGFRGKSQVLLVTRDSAEVIGAN